MAAYTFTPPTVDEGPAAWDNPLFLRVKLTRGITVLVNGDTYTAVRFPTQDELRAADRYYMGGHQYQVDADEKAALLAAGIGVTEDNFFTPLSAYGGGTYGSGLYGD